MDKEKIYLILSTLSVTLTYLLTFVLCLAAEAIILLFLWSWFVVPLDIRPLTYKESLGLLILINFLTYHFYGFKKEDNSQFLLIDSLTFLFARPVLVFLLASIVHFLL